MAGRKKGKVRTSSKKVGGIQRNLICVNLEKEEMINRKEREREREKCIFSSEAKFSSLNPHYSSGGGEKYDEALMNE